MQNEVFMISAKQKKLFIKKLGFNTRLIFVIKKNIKKFLKFFGYILIKCDDYDQSNLKMIGYFKKTFFYYEYYLNSKQFLNPSEILQHLEIKYGGPVYLSENISHFGSAAGGDRMNVFFHSYSFDYARYLEPIRKSNKTLIILEIGILNGTGLAVWDEYFENKELFGFDFNLSNFENNLNYLVKLGAFNNRLPTLKSFDQFADNSSTLNELFLEKKIDVIIDDAFHSDESIINTFNELQPYLSDYFIYFIEDNTTAWKKLSVSYPDLNFDYNDDELTIVTRK